MYRDVVSVAQMTIRLIQERKASNGAVDYARKEFGGDSILIGRAGDCDVVLQGSQFALKHARIVREGTSYYIEDLDPVYEVLLNGKLVQRAALRKGDRLSLSGAVFRITDVSQDLEITQYISESENESAEARSERLFRSLDIRRVLPSMRALSLVLMLAVLSLVALVPQVFEERRHLEAGPVTNHHRMIEGQCANCHTGSFERVSDGSCATCHHVSEHAAAFGKTAHHPMLGRNCVECHREHGEQRTLMPSETKLCADCHSQIKAIYPESKIENITTWDEHPEFSVTLQPSQPGETGSKVSLADRSKLADNSHVKLNHAVHLKPEIRGPHGPVTLQCSDCHKMNADYKTIAPVTMEGNCRSCHGLQFDERLADKEVPHGDPDVVYNFLYAEYAKLMLADQPDIAESQRLRPGVAPEPGQTQTAFVRSEVERAARGAERELFTRTACKTCHEVSEVSDSLIDGQQRSRFRILKPAIPVSWMPNARFNHGSHEELSCESCHTGVRKSEKTTDVLLPLKATCQHCHASQAGGGKLGSDCVLCHSYHDSLPLDPKQKKQWKLGTALAGDLG